MIDVEKRLCQKLAKQFDLPVSEVIKIQRSQFKQLAETFRAKEGKAFSIPYLGEFSIKKTQAHKFIENINTVEK
jgi:hypothetical protein